MKENIRKLTVLVIVPAMALFAMGVISSAGSANRRPFNGQYAATGSSFCWMAQGGFDADGVALGGWAGGPSIWEAEFTFRNDGTGTASGDVRALDLPSLLGGDTPIIWSGTFSYEFTYAFTGAAYITFTSVPNTFILEKPGGPFHFDIVPNRGVITSDSKIIMISSGPPLLLSFMVQGDDGQWHPMGPKQACSVSLVLIKIK